MTASIARHESQGFPTLPYLLAVAAIFAADLYTPMGFATAPFYAVPVFLAALWLPASPALAVAAAAAAGLIAAGVSTWGAAPPALELANRTLAGVAIAAAFAGGGRLRDAAMGQLRVLLDGIQDAAIVMLDPAGTIRIWNRGAEMLFGYAEAEILGQSVDTLLAPQEIATRRSSEDLALARRSGRVDAKGLRSRKDGTVFEAGYSIVALHRRGLASGFAMIAHDLTERRSFERTLQNLMQELSRSNADLEQFAYVASHDLQEPLRAVSGCVQLLERRYRGQLDSGADELIGHVVAGAERMHALINDLLAYSRVATRDAQREPIDLGSVARLALTHLDASVQECGGTVEIGMLPVVAADPRLMRQLFQNLLSNSLKFRGTRTPQISVGAERSGSEWIVRVRDNGIGIAPEHRERIFAIFQRLSTRAEYRGSGIGLAICKKVVERHGGRIWIEGEVGVGSDFCFAIPAGEHA